MTIDALTQQPFAERLCVFQSRAAVLRLYSTVRRFAACRSHLIRCFFRVIVHQRGPMHKAKARFALQYKLPYHVHYYTLSLAALPTNVTRLSCHMSVITDLEHMRLLHNLTHLRLYWGDQNWPKDIVLPPKLTHLAFPCLSCTWCFSNSDSNRRADASAQSFKSLQTVCFPSTLTHLSIGIHALAHIAMPMSLTHLRICDESLIGNVESVSINLPQTLTHLEFEYFFNRPLAGLHWPETLTHLMFGATFNQSLQSVHLPNALTHLVFGDHYNKPLQRVRLPASITHLVFGAEFNQPLDGIQWPSRLTNLTFGCRFDGKFVAVPSTVTHLTIVGEHDAAIERQTAFHEI